MTASAAAPAATGLNAQALPENLLAAIARVLPAVDTHTTMPILQNILVESMDGRLRLTCTDLERTITTFCGARIDQEGATTINTALFSRALQKLPRDNPITLDGTRGRNLYVSCGRAEQQIATMDARDYPKRPECATEPALLDAAALKATIRLVEFGAAKDMTRPVLTGIHIKPLADGGLEFSSADGFRLTITRMDGSIPDEVTIPARVMRELAGVLDSGQVEMRVDEQGRHVFFDTADTQVIGTLLSGAYPNYGQITASVAEQSLYISVDAEALRRAVGVCAPFAGQGNSAVRLEIADPETMRVWSQAPEEGRAESFVDIATDGALGDPMRTRIALTERYLSDALSRLSGKVRLGLNGQSESLTVIPEGDDAGYHWQCIMPLFVQW